MIDNTIRRYVDIAADGAGARNHHPQILGG